MGLDLNTEQEYVRIDRLEIPFFREFYGSNVKMASEVKKAGRVLAPVYVIMERKANSPRIDWNVNYFDSGDGFAYPASRAYQDGRFKVVLNSQELNEMKKDSELVNKGLAIPSYEQVNGKEFKREDVVLEKDLKESEVPDHPVWLELFRGNRELLGQVAQRIFKAGKDSYNYDTMMGIYLAGESTKPHLRAAVPFGLEVRSQLYGRVNLGYDVDGRFVGVAPEALSAPGQLVKPYTQADLEAVDCFIKGLEGVVKTELFNPIKQLRSKL